MGDGRSSKEQQNQKIGVIGLGYVGLPLALLFIAKGFDVVGIDLDSKKIINLAQGVSYLTDISNKEIQAALLTQRFKASDDYRLVQALDSIVICVPTPLSTDHVPDLTYLEQVGNALSLYMRADQLVILESSSYPGTTTEILQPLLEKSGLKVGKEIFLAYSPERIDPGNKTYPISEVPKLLSGVTKECAQRARKLYSQVFKEVVMTSSPETAELAKLVENCHRFINISLMNELAILCESMNVSIWEVIEAASTKPYGFTPYYPGPGIGGHCIPVDPLYLLWKVRQNGQGSKFIELADHINQQMPFHILKRVRDRLAPTKKINEAKILVYGVTYKRDINDLRESAALEILRLFIKEGASVIYHDPYIPQLEIENHVLQSVELTPEILQKMDCVVILVNHAQIPTQLFLDNAPLIFDACNTTKSFQGIAKIFRLGEGN